MESPRDIPVRSARDRVIDLLQIGDTYPLTDLNVVADQLKVTFGGTAKIPIEAAQLNVVYQLCDPNGKPLGPAFKAEGEGRTLVIETPKVEEDVTYRILATKKSLSGSKLEPQKSRFLNESAPVKVGIDTGLVIEMRDIPLLDPGLPTSQPSDPRIVPYGQSVDVWVNNSQEGVVYSLVLDGREVKDVARTGDLHDIALSTGPMHEDVVIQVRATKTFTASENRRAETSLLDAKLYLKVMANPALAFSVEPSPIVDYARDATIRIASTQANAKYRAYARAIPDGEFVRDTVKDGKAVKMTGDGNIVMVPEERDVVRVPVAGKPDVEVLKPVRTQVWAEPAEGYVPLGDEPVPGTGNDVNVSAKSLAEDAIVIVQALKEHHVDVDNPDSAKITSGICLGQAVVVLVRPDPKRALKLRMPVIGAKTGDVMQVSYGQPGVFYYFRRGSSGREFPFPVYFHKRDVQDDAQNKGVGQLGIEIDFAIATDPDTDTVTDRTMAPPRDPLLGITPGATGRSLSSRAVRAQTGVEAKMVHHAMIDAVAAIRADQAVIDYGASATIVIPSSDPRDQYQITLEGTLIRPALTGDGSDMTVITEPMQADAVFEVGVTRLVHDGMEVERVVPVSVLVRPNAALSLSAVLDAVTKDAETDIVVQGSQEGVSYQLMSGNTAIGSAVPGTGADLALRTGPISTEKTFTVVATRLDNASIAVVLQGQPSVKLEPGA